MRTERQAVIEDQVEPALRAAPSVAVRWVDVESLTAACSAVTLVSRLDAILTNRRGQSADR